MQKSIMFYSSMILRYLKRPYYLLTYEKLSILLAVSRIMGGAMGVAPALFVLIPMFDMRQYYVAEDNTEDVMNREVLEDNDSMHLNMTRMKIDGCNAKDNIEFMWTPFLFASFYLFTSFGLLFGVLENRRRLIAFWISISILEIISFIVELVNNEPIQNFSKPICVLIHAAVAILSPVLTYIVWRTYMRLKTRKCCLHDDPPVRSPPASTQTSCNVCADNPNKPYGVITM